MLVETKEVGNLIIEIHTDDCPESPREWDNMGEILYTSDRYVLGDRKASREEIQDICKDPDEVWLPVYAYIHSGITVNTTGFSCPWDSGQCGIIHVSKTDVLKNWNRQRFTAKLQARAEDLLRAEVDTYDQFCRGEVYGYRVLRKVRCPACGNDEPEELDACWGFYGLDYVREEAESVAEYHMNERKVG